MYVEAEAVFWDPGVKKESENTTDGSVETKDEMRKPVAIGARAKL